MFRLTIKRIIIIFYTILSIALLFIPFWYYSKNDYFFYFNSFEYLPYINSNTLGLVHFFPAFAFIIIAILTLFCFIFALKKQSIILTVIPIIAHLISNIIELLALQAYIEKNTLVSYNPIRSDCYGFIISLCFSLIGILLILQDKFCLVQRLTNKMKSYNKLSNKQRIAELERQVAELKQNKED